LFAQDWNGVTVSGLVVTAGTATFNVSWQMPMPVELWSDTVWVFVDYNNAGKMERLPLLPGATLTDTSAPGEGKVIEVENNDRGVWVVGNARSAGSFTATVKLLTATADLAGACVYASNYPPVAEYVSPTQISFTGTTPYTVVLEDSGGGTITQLTGNLYVFSSDYTVKSFTDKTGASGLIKCLPPDSPTVFDATFCYGLPGQLQAAASGNATIVWYDALTAGNLLYSGNVLPLTPLYNNTTQYYAQAVSEKNCPSVARIAANYTLNHCVLNGSCPGFEAGSVGTIPPPDACTSFDSGRIGIGNYAQELACEAFYPGQIGSAAYPVACVSYDAGWIGK
jgi:hypothetical protein